jgi:hypothetical protein
MTAKTEQDITLYWTWVHSYIILFNSIQAATITILQLHFYYVVS